MSKPDTRRDRPTARRQAAAANDRAHQAAGLADSDELPTTDLEAAAKLVRNSLPAGKSRKLFDAFGVPDGSTIAFVNKVLAAQVLTSLSAFKKSTKALESDDPEVIESAAAYLAEHRKMAKVIKVLCDGLRSNAKTQADIDVDRLPSEIRVFGVQALADAFTAPGPDGDLAAKDAE